MLGSPAGGGGGPAQRGGLWPLATAPPTANFATDGFGIYSLPLLPGSPAFGSALYSHSSIGRFTAGSIQPQPPTHTAFHAQHKVSDSIYTSTGYTFGAPTPPPGSPYSPGSVTQLELFAKGGFNSNIIIQQQQQIQSLPEYTASPKKQCCEEKCCVADKPQKPCTCQQQQQQQQHHTKTKFLDNSSGCSRTNPVDWSGGVSVKKEPGLGVVSVHPCQVAEVTTSDCEGAIVKVEVASPTQQVKSGDVVVGQQMLAGLPPVVTTSGNIPVGIAVARQRIQHHEVVSSPSLPPSGLLATVNTTQIKEVARISEIDAGGMAATAASAGGVSTGGGALLQCSADESRGGFAGCWPMNGAQQHPSSALTTPTLWQYPAPLPMEPLVPMPMPLPPVGLFHKLVRDHNTGGFLLLPTTGVEQLQQTVVWPSYHQSPSHVLIPPLPPPPLQLLSSASSDYLQSSTTLHQHTQTHSTRLVAVTTDNKRKLPIPTTLIKIETDAKTLQAVSSINNNNSTGTVFTDPNMAPLVTTHVIYQHPTNLILSSQTPTETTLCKEQATSPVACLTPPPEAGSLQEEETFVQDASNQTEAFVEEERECEVPEEEKIEEPTPPTPPPPPPPTPPPIQQPGPDISGLELLSNSIVEFEKNNKKMDSDDKNKHLEESVNEKTSEENNTSNNLSVEDGFAEERICKNPQVPNKPYKRLAFENADFKRPNKENETISNNTFKHSDIEDKLGFHESNKFDSNNRISNNHFDEEINFKQLDASRKLLYKKLDAENNSKKFEAERIKKLEENCIKADSENRTLGNSKNIQDERASDLTYKKFKNDMLRTAKPDAFTAIIDSDSGRMFRKNTNSEPEQNVNSKIADTWYQNSNQNELHGNQMMLNSSTLEDARSVYPYRSSEDDETSKEINYNKLNYEVNCKNSNSENRACDDSSLKCNEEHNYKNHNSERTDFSECNYTENNGILNLKKSSYNKPEVTNTECNYKNADVDKNNSEDNQRFSDFEKTNGNFFFKNTDDDARVIPREGKSDARYTIFDFERQHPQEPEDGKIIACSPHKKSPFTEFDSEKRVFKKLETPENVFKKTSLEFGKSNGYKSEKSRRFEENYHKSSDSNGFKPEFKIFKSEHKNEPEDRSSFTSKKLDLKIERRSVDYDNNVNFEKLNNGDSNCSGAATNAFNSEFGSAAKFKNSSSEYGCFKKIGAEFREYNKAESAKEIKTSIKSNSEIKIVPEFEGFKKLDSEFRNGNKAEIKASKKLDSESEEAVINFKSSEYGYSRKLDEPAKAPEYNSKILIEPIKTAEYYSKKLEEPVKSSEDVLKGIARMSLSDKESLPVIPLGEDLGGLKLLCALAEQRILEEEEENIAEKLRKENAEKKLKRKYEEEDEIRRWKKEKRRERKKEKKRVEVEEENWKMQHSKELEERLNPLEEREERRSSGDEWKKEKKRLKEGEWRRERKKEKRKLQKHSDEPKKKKSKKSYKNGETEFWGDKYDKSSKRGREAEAKPTEVYISDVTPTHLKECSERCKDCKNSEKTYINYNDTSEEKSPECYKTDCLSEYKSSDKSQHCELSQSSEAGSCNCKEELFKTYKTKESEEEVRKFLASKSQPLCCKGDWPCMNAMELDMRMRLADLQRKYREKQKELSRLKPKRHEKKPNKVRQRKKSDRSTPPPPLLDKMDTPVPKKSGKLQEMLQPPTLCRYEEAINETTKTHKEHSKSKRSNSLHEPNKRSNNLQDDAIKPLKRNNSLQEEATKLLSKNNSQEETNKPHKRNNNTLESTKRSNSFDEDASKSSKKNSKLQEETPIVADNQINDENEILDEVQAPPKPSTKRKVGRPKKMLSSSGLQTVTETIVAKKPKKGLVGYLLAAKEKLVQNGTANPNLDPPRFIEEPVACKKKSKIGPKLKAEATVKTEDEEEEEEEIKVKKDMRCVLTTERLEEDRLRVLTAMGGLFYAGRLNAVEPPDVYSITLDGERGNRPHIMSREEILRDAIVEVSPSSAEELSPGTRLCAYWSQQYRCLYPGSVAEPDSQEDSITPSSKFISVEFDDGDNGRISIEDIRLLPPDYPIIEYDPNPLLSLSKRRRRASTTEERRKSPTPVVEPLPAPPQEVVEEKETLPADTRQKKEDSHRERKRLKKRKREKLLKKKRKHRCLEENCKHKKHHKKHHRKHKKHHHQEKVEEEEEKPVEEEVVVEEDNSVIEEDVSAVEEDEASMEEFPEYHIVPNPEDEVTMDDILEAAKDKNSNKKIRDRQESCESRSKMSAFLPARQLWGWSGKGYRRPKAKGRSRKQFFKAIQRGKESIQVGDSAVFLSTGRPDRPYIGRIEAMWESCGTMVVKVKWFYHPEETIGCPPNLKYPGALFESPHVDENDVQTISHKCEVLPLKDYKEKLGDDPQRYETIYDNNDIYYLAGHYDPTTPALKLEPDIPFTD